MPVQSLTSSYAVPGVRGKLTGQGSAGSAYVNHATTVAGSRFVPPPDNYPVERVIEGELLEKKTSVSGGRQGDFVTRFFQSGGYNSQGKEARVQSSAAIAAYLSNDRLGDENTLIAMFSKL